MSNLMPTNERARVPALLWGLLLAVTLGCAAGLNHYLTQRQTDWAALTQDDPLYASDQGVRRMSLSFNGLVADFYWMRSLQYLGGKVVNYYVTHPDQQLQLDNLGSLDPRQLYPLLDRTTTLDPHFLAAYEYGGIVLPGINPDQAISLLQKGLAHNPDAWRLYHHLGYIYWQKKDYAAASQIYEEGSRCPKAPQWMMIMSHRLKAEGSSRETAREIYRAMAESSDEPQVRYVARQRLLQLDSFDDRDAIRAVLTAFNQKQGRCPANWQEVFPALRALRLPRNRTLKFDGAGVPLDPAEVPYRFISGGCDVDLTPLSSVPYF